MAGKVTKICSAWTNMPSQPSLKHLTSPDYKKTPEAVLPVAEEFGKPHVESFNYITRGGLLDAVQSIPPVEFALPNESRIKIRFLNIKLSNPVVPSGTPHVRNHLIFPSECRQRGTTYKGKLHSTLQWSINDEPPEIFERTLGEIPIMLKSDCCNLSRLSPQELIERGEDSSEFGGYFIINGIEKILRMLIVQRRNYPLAICRNGWKKRGKLFSDLGVSIRCVRSNHTSSNMVLHYLTNGTAKLQFLYQKEMFFVPIVLMMKALCDVTDQYIFKELTRGLEKDSYYLGCVANMLRQIQNENLLAQKQVQQYIGQKFRLKLHLPDWYTDEEVTAFLLQECICVHLQKNIDKFNLLVFMTRKLFALVTGKCAVESPDNPMNQELLLGGHLYLMVLKEKLTFWLNSIKYFIDKKRKSLTSSFKMKQGDLLYALSGSFDISRSIEYLLATGNLISKSGLGIMESSGLSIVLDKINYLRYISNFRCVHRGSFFTQLRDSSVRKLLPEAWGFICPVHTPDGTPCGLLNHLTFMCQVVTVEQDSSPLIALLCRLGMTPLGSLLSFSADKCYNVLLDGKVLGWIPEDIALNVCNHLHYLKSSNMEKVPQYLEIGFVSMSEVEGGQYPGIYLFTSSGRMMRPVRNLSANLNELIGTFEQVYMNISITQEEAHSGTTHQEICETSMLSLLANLIPLSDFNQSPRNMYQCQMAKQAMGTPHHAIKQKPLTKMYRLQTPQSPLVRPSLYDFYQLDDYALGTNAVVAVISYTGYDMEDAMIVNKASLERGFTHGSVYKSECIDLRELHSGSKNFKNREEGNFTFGIKPGDKNIENLGYDGLPLIGTFLEYNDPYYSYINTLTGEARVMKYHSLESAYVDSVRILGNDTGSDILQRVSITLRIPRNPIIGDKFASRHGQKGICSQMWPVEDLPFTESGMIPDIIFNPHGFPSRMTIGMMIESMAGKSAACHGLVHDATPFKFSEDDSAIDYFGHLLQEAGYNYYGTERVYSGINGKELEANIFLGVVYYQRLRHMVADKFQVRTTGPIDILTHQPVKGRSRAGGIRFGEMERDSLLAHGVSFLLQDRLFNCSDRTLEYICKKCGSLLSPIFKIPEGSNIKEGSHKWTCATCHRDDTIELIALPFVFRYLISELAAINIKVTLNIK